MIGVITPHGRSQRALHDLQEHLLKPGQIVTVDRVVGLCANDLSGALDEMAFVRIGTKCEISLQHIALSPRQQLTTEQVDQMVDVTLAAFDAARHGHVLVVHADKPRAMEGGADTHYHLLLCQVGPSGRGLDTSHSYARLEASMRILEFDWKEDITPSRHKRQVCTILKKRGRPDVAAAVQASAPTSPPRSAMSSRGRARAERVGVDLPDLVVRLRAVCAIRPEPAAFISWCDANGLAVRRGSEPNVYVIAKDGIPLGALDRMLRRPRDQVAEWLGPVTFQRTDHMSRMDELAHASELERSIDRVIRPWPLAIKRLLVDWENCELTGGTGITEATVSNELDPEATTRICRDIDTLRGEASWSRLHKPESRPKAGRASLTPNGTSPPESY